MNSKTIIAIAGAAVAVAGLWIPASLFNASSPDAVRAIFSSHGAVIMLAWGLLHTRLPILAKIPNTLAPIFNALGFVLAQFVVPEAHASVATEAVAFGGALWIAIRAAVTSSVTAVLYDKLIKPWLDKALPKAV